MKTDPPPSDPKASDAAAELARKKAEKEREAKAAAPLTTADLADVEKAVRTEFRKELDERFGKGAAAAAQKGKGGWWLIPLVAGVVVVGVVAFAFVRRRRAVK